MENFTGDKAYLKGTNQRYEAVQVEGDTFLVAETCMSSDLKAEWSYDVYMVLKKPSNPESLLFQEVKAVRVRKRKTLLDIAREMSEDFEGHRDEIEKHFDMSTI